MLRVGIGFLSGFFNRVKSGMSLPSVTVKYPEVKRPLPALSRSSFKNDFSECTGCRDCEKLCPVGAIKIDGQGYTEYDVKPTTSKGLAFHMDVRSFKIDHAKCIFCGLCVQNCPTQSLGYGRTFPKGEPRVNSLVVDLVHVPRTVRKTQDEG